MSGTAPKIIGEPAMIKFDLDDVCYIFPFEEVNAFVLGLQASADKASLQFKEVVASRSFVFVASNNAIGHKMSMWAHKGPFTLVQLLEMIKYKEGISSEEWYKHMDIVVSKASESFLLDGAKKTLF
jgi:hypothetical protein